MTFFTDSTAAPAPPHALFEYGYTHGTMRVYTVKSALREVDKHIRKNCTSFVSLVFNGCAGGQAARTPETGNAGG